MLFCGGVVLTLDKNLGDFACADVLVEDGKIAGIHPLARGDRFDIVATLPTEKNPHRATEKPGSSPPPREPEVRVLVSNGADPEMNSRIPSHTSWSNLGSSKSRV